MSPFGPLEQFGAQMVEDIDPIDALIRKQIEKDKEEERKRKEEEARQMAEQAAQAAQQRQQQAQMQGAQAQPQVNPLGQVQQRLVTENQTPQDLRQQYARQYYGMRPEQEKPSFGQKTSAMLAEMVRGMAQGPKYKNAAERINEQMEKDYQLQTSRSQAVTAAQRAEDMAMRYEQLDQQFKSRQAQDAALARERMGMQERLTAFRVKADLDKWDDKKRMAEAELMLKSMNIAPSPDKVAAMAAGVASRFERDPQTGEQKVVYGDLSGDNLKKYTKYLEDFSKAKKSEDDKVIDQFLPIQSTDENGNPKTILQPVQKYIRRGGGSTDPSNPLAAPGEFFKPGTPSPTGTASAAGTGAPLDPRNSGPVSFNKPNPTEINQLNVSRGTQREMRAANATSVKLFKEWAEGGRKPEKGIGKYTQGTEIGGVDATRWATQSDTAMRLKRMFTSANDPEAQREQRELEDMELPMRQAQAAKLRETGGLNLTEGEKKIVKEYWPERKYGPVAYQRGRTIIEAMLYLQNYRAEKKISPGDERDLAPAVLSYVNNLVDKTLKKPKDVSEDEYDPAVFIPKLLTKQEAERRSAPSPNTPRPPEVKTETIVDKVKAKKEEDEGVKTKGARIRRIR